MKYESMRDQVRCVAQRWRNQYRSYKGADLQKKAAIQSELDRLDVETATDADVAKIIGNNSWVCKLKCHECNTETWDALWLGEEGDYEISAAIICINCLRSAIALIESHKTKDSQ